MTLVKLEPVAPPSRVKLFTTEPLRSPDSAVIYNAKDSPCQMPERAFMYIVYKVSKPAPGPEVITSFFVLKSNEHGIYSGYKCKEMLAFTEYLKLESFSV